MSISSGYLYISFWSHVQDESKKPVMYIKIHRLIFSLVRLHQTLSCFSPIDMQLQNKDAVLNALRTGMYMTPSSLM
jgi:hypothetical protein